MFKMLLQFSGILLGSVDDLQKKINYSTMIHSQLVQSTSLGEING